MTAIAGIAHRGKVYLGGDSAGVSGWDLTIRADTKVFVTGPFVMGFTTSFRMGQLLRHAFVPPVHPDGMEVDRFMVTAFVDAVRECLKAGGWAKKDAEREDGGTFLVGYRGRLFTVYGDYQVEESAFGCAAAGCGDMQVMGALFATQGKAPHKRLRVALAAAEALSAGVRGPFHFATEP